jgi:hypothetical protein
MLLFIGRRNAYPLAIEISKPVERQFTRKLTKSCEPQLVCVLTSAMALRHATPG